MTSHSSLKTRGSDINYAPTMIRFRNRKVYFHLSVHTCEPSNPLGLSLLCVVASVGGGCWADGTVLTRGEERDPRVLTTNQISPWLFQRVTRSGHTPVARGPAARSGEQGACLGGNLVLFREWQHERHRGRLGAVPGSPTFLLFLH